MGGALPPIGQEVIQIPLNDIYSKWNVNPLFYDGPNKGKWIRRDPDD